MTTERTTLYAYLKTIEGSSQRRTPDTDLTFTSVQDILKVTSGMSIPPRLSQLWALDTITWVQLTNRHLPKVLAAARQEGSDTITLVHSDANICVLPSAGGDNPEKVHSIKITGVSHLDSGHQMIVSAGFTGDTGALFALGFSTVASNLPDPEEGRPFPRYSYVSRTGYQSYNQHVRKLEDCMRPPFDDGIITPAMLEETDHTHMFRMFQPQRMLDPHAPFELNEPLYVPEINLFFQHDQEQRLIGLGQTQSDLSEWQFVIEDSLDRH